MSDSKKNPQRVAIYIDHSNVHHLLCDMRKIDSLWVKWYNPLTLAMKLVGNRELVEVNFYCAPPPPYLLQEGKRSQKQYWKQMSYYGEVEKLPKVNLKYARLSGVKGDLHEKNLDTQLSTDLILSAAANNYDTAIIISNDGDFVSAVAGVMQLGRKIELAYFKGSVSWELKKACNITRRLRRGFFEELSFTVGTNTSE
jgi:uncharacterized LabA/DUF88 family protein